MVSPPTRPQGVGVSASSLVRALAHATSALSDGTESGGAVPLPEFEGADLQISGITLDSRQVCPGDLYAALPGFVTHGARFAGQAIEAGAVAILTDPTGRDVLEATGVPGDFPILSVPDPRAVLGEVSAHIYGHPARHLRIAGVTGTNGKTTTAYLVDAALREAGIRSGVIGTVAIQIGDEVLPASRTTPEAPDLHALLAVMVQRGVEAVTMEVSSHALSLGRVDAVEFEVAAYTNLSQDHLDFHGDMAAYFEAKAALFAAGRIRSAIICVDDPWGRELAVRRPVADQQTVSIARAASGEPGPGGLAGEPSGGEPSGEEPTGGEPAGEEPAGEEPAGEEPADWIAENVVADRLGGSSFHVRGPDGIDMDCAVGLPGAFNVANAVTALAIAVRLGVPARVAATGIGRAARVPGRMERVDCGQDFLAVVDYAHTPDAVRRALQAVRDVVAPRGGRVLAVLGCGGDRDPGKRAAMGREAATVADVAIITDDNPRSESPEAIRAAIMSGAAEVDAEGRAQMHEMGDRRSAIGLGVASARSGDALVVLGKGHEQGQEVAGVVHPFDDRQVLREALGRNRGRAGGGGR